MDNKQMQQVVYSLFIMPGKSFASFVGLGACPISSKKQPWFSCSYISLRIQKIRSVGTENVQ